MPRFVTVARIAGMRSVHCTRAVYTALASLEGVATVDVAIGQATIEHDGRATEGAIRAGVELAGYELLETSEERQRSLPLL